LKYKKGKLKRDGGGIRIESILEQNIQESLPAKGR
jgi:hypothetical protein